MGVLHHQTPCEGYWVELLLFMVLLWVLPSGFLEQLHNPAAAFHLSHCGCLGWEQGRLEGGVQLKHWAGHLHSPAKPWTPLQAREQQPQAAAAKGDTGKAAPGKQSWVMPKITRPFEVPAAEPGPRRALGAMKQPCAHPHISMGC